MTGPDAGPLAAIQAEIDALVRLATDEFELICWDAARQTPLERWGHLEVILLLVVPPTVACSWPDPIPGNPMVALAERAGGMT